MSTEEKENILIHGVCIETPFGRIHVSLEERILEKKQYPSTMRESVSVVLQKSILQCLALESLPRGETESLRILSSMKQKIESLLKAINPNVVLGKKELFSTKIERGIPQGDAFSPTLFILMLEYQRVQRLS